MEAIRKRATVKNSRVSIELPARYNNMEVELIILPAGDEMPKAEEKVVDYYSKYYGTLNSRLSVEEIDKQIQELRNEWNRDPS